ncbi:MAG: hypothetical protein LBE18_00520 [Planctomycetaceae bacterium]|jgi:hypothetical protein|nr:hypothetical protein [Planctomycetaceae bacterium]
MKNITNKNYCLVTLFIFTIAIFSDLATGQDKPVTPKPIKTKFNKDKKTFSVAQNEFSKIPKLREILEKDEKPETPE